MPSMKSETISEHPSFGMPPTFSGYNLSSQQSQGANLEKYSILTPMVRKMSTDNF